MNEGKILQNLVIFSYLAVNCLHLHDTADVSLRLGKFLRCSYYVCAAHNMHSFKRFFARSAISGKTQQQAVYKYGLGRMVVSSNYPTIKTIFKHLCVLALSSTYDDAVKESKQYMDALVEAGKILV